MCKVTLTLKIEPNFNYLLYNTSPSQTLKQQILSLVRIYGSIFSPHFRDILYIITSFDSACHGLFYSLVSGVQFQR